MIDLWMHFLCNMARFLAPKIIEKPKNTDSKRHHKIDQFLNRFLIDFCSVLDAKLDPCWPPFSAQDGPRGLQDGLRTLPRRSQERPKIQYNLGSRPKQGYPIGPGRGDTPSAQVVFWSIFGRFWLIVARCLVDFWINVLLIFGRFLVDFCSSIFCRFLIDF